MYRARFRDPSGVVRTGTWADGEVTFADQSYPVEDVDVLPPCEPSKIVCIGHNYQRHVEELGEETPDRPFLFLKGPNTYAAHGDRVTLPRELDRVDHEAELGVVIGEQCRRVSAADAMDVVAGYTAIDDVSNRDDVGSDPALVRVKGFDGAAPMGPVVATPDEVPDDATVACRVNGETRQSGRLDDLIFPIPELIEEVTRLVTLEPGDVLSTGTPEGIGPLAPGDTVEVDVEGIPTLRHGVRAE
jgi:2-keto-4-pentenoate hydratase/2-oxohepta-3-ene-1,7-dioic acid hydratase in catechol pathway